MATKLLMILPLFSLLLLLATTISARPGIPFHPCNTLIISTYSFSLHSHNPINPNNPNPDFAFMDLHPAPRRFFRGHFFLPLRRFPQPLQSEMTDLSLGFKDRTFTDIRRSSEMTDLPLGFKDRTFVEIRRPSEITDLPLGFSSMKNRTKDILSVVASLLFGAACGALTAGTMYLIWSILNFRHGDYRSVDGFSSDDDDDNDDDEDIFNPKKSHYVAVPAADFVKVKDVDSVDAKEAV